MGYAVLSPFCFSHAFWCREKLGFDGCWTIGVISDNLLTHDRLTKKDMFGIHRLIDDILLTITIDSAPSPTDNRA